MLINLRNALMAGKRLPYDAEVEYLKSTGTQYVALPPLPNPCTFEFEATFAQSSSAGTSAVLFGCKRGDVSANNIMQFVPKYPLYDMCGASPTRSSPSTTLPNDTFVTVSHKGGVFDFNGEKLSKTNTYSTVNNYTAFGLFCAWSQTTGVFGEIYRCKLANFKVWIDGILRYDYIPVRKGTVGYLYDRVSGKLFGNAGTGDFVLGPDVVPVEYIESHGTERILTDIYTDANTAINCKASGTSGSFFGVLPSSNTAWWTILPNDFGKLRYYYGGSGATDVATIDATVPHDYQCSSNVLVDGVEAISLSRTLGSANVPLSLFARTASSGTSFTSLLVGRMWYLQIIQSGATVRSFRSVRVGTEGAMMDVLTRRVYRNAGTGAFGYGNDLKYPTPAS